MPLTSGEITLWVNAFLWTLVRIGALLSVAPGFGHRGLPRRIRLVLTVAITWAVLPFIPPVPLLDPISPAGLLVTVQQVLIGVALGFLLRLVFGALEVGGQLLAMQMGLGFATLIDPQGGNPIPLVSTFYNLLGTLVFLSLNGHLAVLRMLIESFQLLPIAAEGLLPENLWTLVNWASHLFAGAVLIALPGVASLLVVNLAFGVMTRAAPQLNIFAVGFPVTLIMGLLVMFYSLPTLLPQLERLLESAMQTAEQMLI
jgi:flagellar biosynthetic protein FliR